MSLARVALYSSKNCIWASISSGVGSCGLFAHQKADSRVTLSFGAVRSRSKTRPAGSFRSSCAMSHKSIACRASSISRARALFSQNALSFSSWSDPFFLSTCRPRRSSHTPIGKKGGKAKRRQDPTQAAASAKKNGTTKKIGKKLANGHASRQRPNLGAWQEAKSHGKKFACCPSKAGGAAAPEKEKKTGEIDKTQTYCPFAATRATTLSLLFLCANPKSRAALCALPSHRQLKSGSALSSFSPHSFIH